MREKTKFKQTKEKRSFEVSSQMKQTEIGEIPEDWELSKINTIGKVITGKNPFINDYENQVLDFANKTEELIQR